MPIVIDFTLEEFEELLKDHENPDHFTTAFYHEVVRKCGMEDDWPSISVDCTEIVGDPEWNKRCFVLLRNHAYQLAMKVPEWEKGSIPMHWTMAWMNAGPSNTNSHPGIQVGPDQLHCTDKAFTWLDTDQTEPS